MRFQFIKENQNHINVKKACKLLNVSRSGYYKYISWKPSSHTIENNLIRAEIKQIFDEHKGRYGSSRISKELENKGILVSRKRVAKLMRMDGLYPKGTPYHYRRKSGKQREGRPNLLNQIFEAKGRNQIWLGDITYIPTRKKTLYLAVFLDVYSRKIVGWSMDTRMKEKLVIDAFNQAYGREHPEAGLIVHTDQGAQYTGNAFRSLVRSHKAIISNSRKGTPYDNAPMESFYRTLKRELINDVRFKNPEEAKAEIFKYIETYYNTKRMHSALGYLTPTDFEKMLTK